MMEANLQEALYENYLVPDYGNSKQPSIPGQVFGTNLQVSAASILWESPECQFRQSPPQQPLISS
jgi:hypothetical protein